MDIKYVDYLDCFRKIIEKVENSGGKYKYNFKEKNPRQTDLLIVDEDDVLILFFPLYHDVDSSLKNLEITETEQETYLKKLN